uniref:Glycosyltransferase n=1 Tax=Syphacia muris TaxID=451379 RepID=A0A0N5AMM1_9BILA
MRHWLKWQLRLLASTACSRPKTCLPVTVRLIFGILIGTLLGLCVRIIVESAGSMHINVGSGLDTQFIRKNSTVLCNALHLRCVVFLDRRQEKKTKYMSALKDTYMQRCNQTIVFTNSKEVHKKFVEDTHVIYMETWKSEYYWDLYRLILKQLTKNEMSDSDNQDSKDCVVDWTIIGNEQLYVVVENLRNYLSGIDSETSIILGSLETKRNILSLIFPFGSHTVLSVQAGIILSRQALHDLQSNQCTGIFFPSSTESALFECASKIGVNVLEPRDQDGMRLLHPLNVKQLIGVQNSLSTGEGNKVCCSDHAISFGSVDYKELRLLDYTINKVKVFGVNMA